MLENLISIYGTFDDFILNKIEYFLMKRKQMYLCIVSIKKARILILLLILTFSKKASTQSSQIQILDHEMYIYEFAIKKGRANIGFLIIDNNLCRDISFDVHFSKDKIKKVDKFVRTYYYDNNIAEKLGSFYYGNDDFVKKRRLIPDNIYKMISPSFLEITNKERLRILDGFSKYKCDFNYSNIKFKQIYELQIHDFSEIPEELLYNLDKMGVDDSIILNEYEGNYLNFIFNIDSQDYNLADKKVAFRNGKKEYFKETQERFQNNTTIIGGSSLYIFDAVQKIETGGYDAAIVYWNKRLLTMEEVIRRFKRIQDE